MFGQEVNSSELGDVNMKDFEFLIQLPTLDQVYQILKGKVKITIEIKIPISLHLKPLYDNARCVQVLVDNLFVNYNQGALALPNSKASNHVVIVSFDHHILKLCREYQTSNYSEQIRGDPSNEL